MDLLFWTHPTAVVALLLAFLGRGEWPPRWVSVAWVLTPTVINSPLWAVGSRLFGWEFGGLGGFFYFWLVLPLNALLLGLSAPQFLHSRLRWCPSEGVEVVVGATIELGILWGNLALLSRVDVIVGNVAS
jgi:hypothetical protein